MTGSPDRRAYPRLEPDEGKLSCPVLRGGSTSNDALLPDYDHFYKEPKRGIVEVGCWAHYPDTKPIQRMCVDPFEMAEPAKELSG